MPAAAPPSSDDVNDAMAEAAAPAKVLVPSSPPKVNAWSVQRRKAAAPVPTPSASPSQARPPARSLDAGTMNGKVAAMDPASWPSLANREQEMGRAAQPQGYAEKPQVPAAGAADKEEDGHETGSSGRRGGSRTQWTTLE